MEMNTRLQVEHPVSRANNRSRNLVAWQLDVAQGKKPASGAGAGYRLNGHAIEARLYAEDPANASYPPADA